MANQDHVAQELSYFKTMTKGLEIMIQKVREIHKPVFFENEVDCTVCSCVYPCPTIEALGGEYETDYLRDSNS